MNIKKKFNFKNILKSVFDSRMIYVNIGTSVNKLTYSLYFPQHVGW